MGRHGDVVDTFFFPFYCDAGCRHQRGQQHGAPGPPPWADGCRVSCGQLQVTPRQPIRFVPAAGTLPLQMRVKGSRGHGGDCVLRRLRVTPTAQASDN